MKRLLDLKVQESYYNEIVKRYMAFCASTGSRDELETQFASLSLTEDADRQALKASVGSAKMSNRSQELSTILFAMRKVREAIVATHRADTFAQRAYIFIIHAAILTKHMESYHPALTYLLNTIHPRRPLSSTELQEFVGYQVLDLACRQYDLAAAYALKNKHKFRDRRVSEVVNAMAHDNWFQFWRIRRLVDGYQKKLMEWAEEGMRLHALKCLGRSYLSADKSYVEKCAERSWESLKRDGVGWELQGQTVIIRRPKAR